MWKRGGNLAPGGISFWKKTLGKGLRKKTTYARGDLNTRGGVLREGISFTRKVEKRGLRGPPKKSLGANRGISVYQKKKT